MPQKATITINDIGTIVHSVFQNITNKPIVTNFANAGNNNCGDVIHTLAWDGSDEAAIGSLTSVAGDALTIKDATQAEYGEYSGTITASFTSDSD